MRLEKPRYSFLVAARLARTVVVAFFSGLIASGTFWYALFLVFQYPSILPLPLSVLILFDASTAITCVFAVASLMLRRQLPMRYTIFPFMIGGLIAATVEIIGFGISAWASWVTATGG